MEKLLEVLNGIVDNNELTVGAKSIEQKQRNAMKKDLTDAVMDLIKGIVGDNDLIKVYRTEKGVMLGLDNEKIGIIPVEFQVAIKNMDCDPSEEEEAYKEKLAEAAAKKEAQAKAKAAKIKRDAEERALKDKIRAMKKAGINPEATDAESDIEPIEEDNELE